MDSRKGSPASFTLRAVDCLWKRSSGRLDANCPPAIGVSDQRFEINLPDISVWDHCNNDCASHAAVAAHPGLLNRNPGSGFHDF